ncbi:unnamed protein product [Moneuplotes crassus]|uniref:PA14 domain-containing protein n=1 Tax=Euplotes crassus TaxID=5936 RepID=A0AAD1XZD3_EUPCR|nr:unnamed protein product [Moneuplotes crassus]
MVYDKFNSLLALGFDTTQSTITGVTAGDTLVINQTYTLTVQAKDQTGNDLAAGGENIYAYLSDPCTRASSMACVSSSYTQSALRGLEKIQKLTDNVDGTYTTDLELSHIGNATLSVLRVAHQDITGEYYDSGIISGNPDATGTSSFIDFDWGFDVVAPSLSNDPAARFTGKITVFSSGTYNMAMLHDDGSSIKINGYAKISMFGTPGEFTNTFSHHFNAFETYDLEIDWIDSGGEAALALRWDSGSGSITIPSENYAIADDIATSPLQISVSCPDKYEQVSSTTNQCKPICGDGFIDGSESCDDGNTVSGDGCSSDCTSVETTWKCNGSSPSVCTRDYKSIPLSDHETTMKAAMISSASLAVTFQAVGGLMNGSSPSTIFSSINQLQLLMLFLLCEIFLPLKVVNYLRSLSSALFDINIDWSFFTVFRKIIEWFDYPQDRDDFDTIDISSGSSLINLNTLIATFGVFIITHIVFSLIIFCFKKSTGRLTNLLRSVYKAFTFKIYVVLIFEGFISLCLCSFSELRRFKANEVGSEQNSFYFSVFFSLCTICVISIALTVWIFAKPSETRKHIIFEEELFKGLNQKRLSRLQPILFLARRTVLCLMIIFGRVLGRFLFMGLYSFISLAHCVLTCCIRPFEKVRNNITEISNELYIVYFCIFLMFNRTEEDWSDPKTTVIYWSLVSNSALDALLSLVFLIYTLFKKKRKIKVTTIQKAKNVVPKKPRRLKLKDPPRLSQILPNREELKDLRRYKFRHSPRNLMIESIESDPSFAKLR